MSPPCPSSADAFSAPAPQPAEPSAPADPLGYEVDVDLREVDDATAARIRSLLYTRKLLVFRNQELDQEAYVRFARVLGTPEPYFQEHYRHPEHPEIFVSANVLLEGQKVGVAGTGRMWHADYSFFERPLAFTLISPRILPSVRRETYFIDMSRVYRDLPDDLRRIADRSRCLHDACHYYKVQPWDVDRAIAELIEEFHAVAPGVHHPAVITHPVTGERILYVSRGFTTSIEGMPHERGQAVLRELFEFSEQPRYVHTQVWQEGDVLAWDNRSFIHHASTVPRTEKSCSYRISVYDELPFSSD